MGRVPDAADEQYAKFHGMKDAESVVMLDPQGDAVFFAKGKRGIEFSPGPLQVFLP